MTDTDSTVSSNTIPPPHEAFQKIANNNGMSAFEIDDGDDVENGDRPSLEQNVHSLPTLAEVTGKRETDDAPKAAGPGVCCGASVCKVMGFATLVVLALVGMSVGLAYGLKDPRLQQYSSQQNQQTTTFGYDNDNRYGNNVNNNNNNNNNNVVPSTPSTSTTQTKEQRYDDILNYLIDNDISRKSDLIRMFTGQFAALDWIAHTDEAKLSVPTASSTASDRQTFVVRYVMAVLFFETEGGSWTNSLNFLTDKHVCDWFELFASSQYNMFPRGVACSEDKEVEAVFLDSNNLFGRLPKELALLTSLTAINFDINSLTGLIPKEFRDMTKLQHLSLAHNQLSGNFPPFFHEMIRLETMDLSYNYLSGTIPVGSNPTLTALAADNNLLVGGIANAFGGINARNPNIEFLYLEGNNITDTLDNNFLTRLPKLRRLDASDNNLGGNLPAHLFTMESLEVLDLHNNKLDGTLALPIIPNNMLKFLALQENKLSSTIPLAIENFKEMFHLDLSSNDFVGSMPYTMGEMTNLTYLFLAGNNYVPGPIPLFLNRLTNLVDLSLKDTKRTGVIPDSIGDNLKQLILLDLDSNGLKGSIPTTIGNLKSLQFLLLNNNNLTGNVPAELGNLVVLRLFFIDGNDVRGSFNSIYCNRPATQYKPYVVADCGSEGGAIPEVACSCCFKCCTDANPCNDEKLVPSNDPMWQFGYQRLFYTFGDRTSFFAV